MLIEENKSLKNYTTFGLDTHCAQFVQVNTIDDIHQLINDGYTQKNYMILGGGSNLVFKDFYNGLIIHNHIMGTTIIREDDDELVVKVGAGEPWHEFVVDMAQKNLWGLENLALIPGTVGASPVQNIGAYGVEAKDTITHVYVIDIHSGEEIVLSREECKFGYRDSIFKHTPGKYMVTHVEFTLSKIPRLQLEYDALIDTLAQKNINDPSTMDMVTIISEIRSGKLPAVGEIGMAGSFFKNPIIENHQADELIVRFPSMRQFPINEHYTKISAGWLIDYLGYKGIREGNVGTYHKHALVLVNYGNATGAELWTFANKIIQDVQSTFGIILEPEVILI